MNHLEMQLVIFIQCLQIRDLDKLSGPFVAHTYPVIEISKPYDGVMVFD